MVTEGTAYFFVAAALATGLLCGFVWGNLWAWWQEDKERPLAADRPDPDRHGQLRTHAAAGNLKCPGQRLG